MNRFLLQYLFNIIHMTCALMIVSTFTNAIQIIQIERVLHQIEIKDATIFVIAQLDSRETHSLRAKFVLNAFYNDVKRFKNPGFLLENLPFIGVDGVVIFS